MRLPGAPAIFNLATKLCYGSGSMAKRKFPLNPKHPERICWGCDKYCPANNLMCGNGSGRTEHPAEMLGEDWYTWEAWGLGPDEEPVPDPSADA